MKKRMKFSPKILVAIVVIVIIAFALLLTGDYFNSSGPKMNPSSGGGAVSKENSTRNNVNPILNSHDGLVKNVGDQGKDTLNVKSFGAKGNGVANDGKAIQKAIDALKTGQVLYFPNGKYIISQTLIPRSNITIIGESQNAILQYQWGKFSKTRKLVYGFLFTNQKNVTFKNFSIDGGASNYKQIIIDDRGNQTWDVDGAYNLFFFKPESDFAVNNIKFDHLRISNSFFDAIHCYARPADPDPKYFTSNITVKNCYFYSMGCHGVGFGKIKGAVVENCIFKNIGLMAMTNSGYGSGLGVDASGGSEDILIQNNTVDGAGGGFKTETHPNNGGRRLPSKNIRILNNTIRNLYSGQKYRIFYGIKINGINCVAKGNKISSYGPGILIGIDAASCTISNNTISQTKSSDAAGIRCDMNGGNINISNNFIDNSEAQGILIAANGVTLSDNVIRNSASDNIRVVLGNNIKILNNICYNGNNNGICVVPVKGKHIDNVEVQGNICYDTRENSLRTQKKGILIANALNVKTISNSVYNNILNNMPGNNVKSTLSANLSGTNFRFASRQPTSGKWSKGDVAMLKKPIKQEINGKNAVLFGWKCVEAGSPGSWRKITIFDN